MDGFAVGLEKSSVLDVQQEIDWLNIEKFDFIVSPLFHLRLRRDAQGISDERDGPSTRSDRELESRVWTSRIVAKLSSWIDTREVDPLNTKIVEQEIQWTLHLGLRAILFPSPALSSPSFAHLLTSSLSANSTLQYWVTIPLVLPLSFKYRNEDGKYEKDGWLVWNQLRSFCNHDHRVCVALEISDPLSEAELLEDIFFNRWRAEPVKAIIISTKSFTFNKAGFPILSRDVQKLLSLFLQTNIKIILKGRSHHATHGYQHYVEYLKHFRLKCMAHLNDSDRLSLAYRDVLQAPLQPLMDNLESQTYEVFEQDPVKYSQYQKAIEKALLVIHAKQISNEEVVITVVGAGRGPLVSAALSASLAVDIPVKVYAVEKNPNAVITLRNRIITERWDNVQIFATDMRDWKPPELSDIMVSELLGSLGDNELSPECLDGAQKCLKVDGISIPVDYTSYLSPISSSKLWMCAREMLNGKGLETPYVVNAFSYFNLAEPQKLFSFYHPQFSDIDNSR